MTTPHNLTPLLALFEEDSPQRLAAFIDEIMMILVCYSDTQEGILRLSDYYHRLRLLRDSFQQTHVLTPSLNGNSGH